MYACEGACNVSYLWARCDTAACSLKTFRSVLRNPVEEVDLIPDNVEPIIDYTYLVSLDHTRKRITVKYTLLVLGNYYCTVGT